MIQITKKERAAIQKMFPDLCFAHSKWHIFMEERATALDELRKLRHESPAGTEKKRVIRRRNPSIAP